MRGPAAGSACGGRSSSSATMGFLTAAGLAQNQSSVSSCLVEFYLGYLARRTGERRHGSSKVGAAQVVDSVAGSAGEHLARFVASEAVPVVLSVEIHLHNELRQTGERVG